MGRDRLLVVETFRSIQGEGAFQGQKALFIRLGLCNLRCRYCDTKYALKKRKPWESYTPKSLYQYILRSYPDVLNHIVFTGGEPMLYEENIYRTILPLIDRIELLEIETNGTIEPEVLQQFPFVVFNVSIKLANSGESEEKRINDKAINIYSNLEHAFFKFVIESEKDIKEVLDIKRRFFIPDNKIYLMPLSSTKTEYRKRAPSVFGLAMKYGFNYSCRLQIEIFGGRKRGV